MTSSGCCQNVTRQWTMWLACRLDVSESMICVNRWKDLMMLGFK